MRFGDGAVLFEQNTQVVIGAVEQKVSNVNPHLGTSQSERGKGTKDISLGGDALGSSRCPPLGDSSRKPGSLAPSPKKNPDSLGFFGGGPPSGLWRLRSGLRLSG